MHVCHLNITTCLAGILPANLVASKTPAPFYTTLDASELGAKALSMQPVTDKISVHTYEGMYSSYFEANSARRYQKLKILEIGLGCNMNYGPGASAKLWKEYFPNSEVWFAGRHVCSARSQCDRCRYA